MSSICFFKRFLPKKETQIYIYCHAACVQYRTEYILLLEARDAWRRTLAGKDAHKETSARVLQLIEDALRLYDGTHSYV